jgi:hypothetical protein
MKTLGRCWVSLLVTMVCGVVTAHCQGNAWAPKETMTLSELSKTPGVKVKVEKLPKPEDQPIIPGLPPPDFEHPINRVTILFFPGTALFHPDFFKTYGGGIFSPCVRGSTWNASRLKLYIVIRDDDQHVLAYVPLTFDVLSDAEAPEMHFATTFDMTTDMMKRSYLWVTQVLNGSDYPSVVYLGTAPVGK